MWQELPRQSPYKYVFRSPWGKKDHFPPKKITIIAILLLM